MMKFWNWIHDDSGGRVLRLEGPIDSESFWGDEITPQMFRDELYAEEGDITLWVNSPGGNVFAAAEIYTMLRDYPGNVTVRIASIAASAASVVAMALPAPKRASRRLPRTMSRTSPTKALQQVASTSTSRRFRLHSPTTSSSRAATSAW